MTFLKYVNMEITEILNVLSEFSDLGAEELHAEIEAYREQIGKNWNKTEIVFIFFKIFLFADKIHIEIDFRLWLLHVMEEELAEMQPIVEILMAASENLDVELVS
jgi:hypothetical protein